MPGIATIAWDSAFINTPPPAPAYVQFTVYNSPSDKAIHSFYQVSPPTSGNLLILVASAGATLNIPSGWARNSTLVNDVETSIYSKVSAGTEYPITIVATGVCTLQAVFIEFPSTWSTFDKQVTDTGSVGGGTMVFGTTAATAAASEIAIACGGSDLSAPLGDPRPTTAWGNGFTEISNTGSNSTTGPPYAIMLGVSFKVLSATGTVTTTWTFHDPGSTIGVWNTLIATYR